MGNKGGGVLSDAFGEELMGDGCRENKRECVRLAFDA